MITVQRLRNILQEPDRADAPVHIQRLPGQPVRAYLPPDFDLDGGHLVLLDYRSLTGSEVDTTVPQDGAYILAAEAPGVGAAFVVWAGLAASETLAATLLGAVVDFIVVGVISIGLSYGIQALMGPTDLPNLGKDDGPTRSWDGIQDTVGNGMPIPFIYGEVRCGGHFLASFERQTSGDQETEGTTTLYSLLGLGMGPLESISDIQLNGNTVETIPDVTIYTRLGTADQAYIPGFNDVVFEDIRQAAITHQDGTLQLVTKSEVDAVEVIFRFPSGLYRVSPSTGAMKTYDVKFDIAYRPVGMDDYTYTSKTVSAKTRSPYKAVWRADGLERGKYEIRVTRVTIDDEEQGNKATYYISISEVYAVLEIKNECLAHPGIATVGFKQIPSEQLNSGVPTNYTFLVQGLNDIRIYTDVDTYYTGYTDNPAWCCLHFLTNPLFGLGVDWADIDLSSFLEWADYCDDVVDDGDGGIEARCTIGHIFDQYQSADKILEIFTHGTGAMLTRRGTKWYVVLDREDQMVWIGNEANTTDVSESHVSQLDRANRIRVTFTDKDNDYQRDSHSRELLDLDQGDLFVDTSRELWGVTRRSQVDREITRYLLHNKLDDWKIELEAGIDSLRVQPGAVFGWTSYTSGVGLAGGKLVAVDSTNTELTLDQEVTLETGKSYEIVVMHQSNGTITTMRLVDLPGTYQVVHAASSTWQGAVAAGDVYSLGEYTAAITKYRCISVTMTQDLVRKIVGMRYDPQVYTFDLEAEPTIVPPSIPDPRQFPPDPADLILYEHQTFEQDGTLTGVIDVDWTAPITVTISHYEVWYRVDDTVGWTLAGLTRSTHFEIRDVESPDVTYTVAVVAVSTVGMKRLPGDVPSASIVTTGLLSQPPNCTGLSVVIIDGTLVATCAAIDPALLGPGGYYEWRRGETWERSVLLDTTSSPRLEMKSYGRGTTYILVKAVNSVGNKSPVAVAFQVTLYGQVEENIILTQDEAPSWSGTLDGLQIVSNKLELYEPQTSVVWVVPQLPTNVRGARFFSFGYPEPTQSVRLEAYYTTDPILVSGGSVVLARADAAVTFEPLNIGLGTFDEATFSFDNEKADVPFSGEEPDKVRVLVESRYSTTDTNEASWSSWIEHRNRGEITMKYLQLRLHVIVDSDAYGVQISAFSLAIDLPDKIAAGTDTALSAVSETVTYPTNYFVAVKRLLVTLIGGAVGEYFRVTAQSSTGFTWEIRDGSGNLQPGTIHYEARGY